ncbi:hypothetical protein CIC12_32120 [Burkholderia sp. SG-MS1]|nr:hypothetical protein [Paraburkholderia sp. SG-MS1]
MTCLMAPDFRLNTFMVLPQSKRSPPATQRPMVRLKDPQQGTNPKILQKEAVVKKTSPCRMKPVPANCLDFRRLQKQAISVSMLCRLEIS